MKYVLDTDTCIHLLRGRETVVHQAALHSPSDLAVSAITRYELLYGVEKCPPAWKKREANKVRLLLEQLRLLPFTAETAVQAAELRAQLEASGDSIGPMDVLIAATALEYGLPIVSGNLAEFSRVPRLRTLTWSR